MKKRLNGCHCSVLLQGWGALPVPVTVHLRVCFRVNSSCPTHDAGREQTHSAQFNNRFQLSISQKGTRQTRANKNSSKGAHRHFRAFLADVTPGQSLPLFHPCPSSPPLISTGSPFAPAALYFMTGAGYVPRPGRGKRARFEVNRVRSRASGKRDTSA